MFMVIQILHLWHTLNSELDLSHPNELKGLKYVAAALFVYLMEMIGVT